MTLSVEPAGSRLRSRLADLSATLTTLEWPSSLSHLTWNGTQLGAKTGIGMSVGHAFLSPFGDGNGLFGRGFSPFLPRSVISAMIS